MREADPPPDFDLRKMLGSMTALVTGAGGVIGSAITRELLFHGATVYCTDIDGNALGQLESSQLEPAPSGMFVADIADSKQIDNLVAWLDERDATVNVLVNNVGVGFRNEATQDESVDARFDRVFRTNLFGPLRLSTAITDRMVSRGQGGSIVFLSSIHQWTVHGEAAYSASKAAIGMVVNELAIDVAKHGIRVNGVAPGWVATDESGQTKRHDPTPLHGGSIPPAVIGRNVAYLASDYFSSHTTGALVTVDAGLSKTNYLT